MYQSMCTVVCVYRYSVHSATGDATIEYSKLIQVISATFEVRILFDASTDCYYRSW